MSAKSVVVQKYHTFYGHTDAIFSLSAVDQFQFVSSGADGKVILWDIRELGKARVIAQIPTSVYSLSVNNKEIYIGQNFDGLHRISLVDKLHLGSLHITSGSIFEMTCGPESLGVVSSLGEVILVDKNLQSITLKKIVSQRSARSICEVGADFWVGCSDHCIRILDKNTLVEKQVLSHHKNSVFTLVYDPIRHIVLSGSRDAHIAIWQANDFQLLKDIPAHMYAVNHLCFDPEYLYFVSVSMDKSIKIWDAETYQLIKVIDKSRHAGHGTSVNKVVWLPKSNFVVSCSDDRSISVWELTIGER